MHASYDQETPVIEIELREKSKEKKLKLLRKEGVIEIRERTHPHTYTDRQILHLKILAANGWFVVEEVAAARSQQMHYEGAVSTANSHIYSAVEIERLRLLASVGKLVIHFTPNIAEQPAPALRLILDQAAPLDPSPLTDEEIRRVQAETGYHEPTPDQAAQIAASEGEEAERCRKNGDAATISKSTIAFGGTFKGAGQ
jgi:hypothetical protein